MRKNELIAILKEDSRWESRRDAAEQLRAFKDDDVIDVLVSVMQKDQEWVVRFKSADSLGEIGSTKAVSSLISALNDSHPTVIEEAALALGKIGDERAIEPLLSLLGYEKDSRPGEAAAKALARFGEKVVSRIIQCLENNEKRSAAITALGIIQDRIALLPLADILKNESLKTYFRREAAYALGNLNDTNAIEHLTVALAKATDQKFVDSIIWALKKLGADPEKLDDLVEIANKKAVAELLENLSKIKKGMQEKVLTDLIGGPKFSMDRSAAFSMFSGNISTSTNKIENWVFGSKFGDFQIVIENGFVADMHEVNRIIEKISNQTPNNK